jgi:YVTN family beta-propeller protein
MHRHAVSVSVIDTRTAKVKASVPLGGYPEGIAARGDRVYVVNWMDDNVT